MGWTGGKGRMGLDGARRERQEGLDGGSGRDGGALPAAPAFPPLPFPPLLPFAFLLPFPRFPPFPPSTSAPRPDGVPVRAPHRDRRAVCADARQSSPTDGGLRYS